MKLFMRCFAGVLAWGILALGETAQAQSNGLFGTGGARSSATATTGSGFSSSGGLGSSLGSSSSFGSSFGSASSSPFGGSSGSTLSGGMGNGRRSTFVGASDAAGRFVGDSQAGAQVGGLGSRSGPMGQMGQFSRGMTSRTGGGGSNFGQQGFNMSGNEQATPGAAKFLRPMQRVAFPYKAVNHSVTEKRLNVRFKNLASRPALQGAKDFTVDLQGDTAIVRGKVNSEETRRLVGMLVAMEPGVSKVENELVIAVETKSANDADSFTEE